MRRIASGEIDVIVQTVIGQGTRVTFFGKSDAVPWVHRNSNDDVMAELPDEFIVRTAATSSTKPWGNYILVQKMMGAADAPPMLVPTLASVGVSLTVPAQKPTTPQVFWGTFTLSGPSGQKYGKRIYIIPDFRLKKSDGTLLKVFTMAAHQTILGTHVKRNFNLIVEEAAAPATATPATPTPAPAPVVPTQNQAPATISHVEDNSVLSLKKKLHNAQKALKALTGSPSYHSSSSSSKRGLAPFVAKQLLQLAIIRHEMCPIVAEEFSDGNCAAMPCGHLFAKMAIEESFKKEPSKCPACRQTGVPTFV
jgi:hypothetical protein